MTDAVHTIVARELDQPPVRVERVEEGLLHETYRVRCGGTDYVLQFASGADEERADSLRRGVACYAALQDTEVPVPSLVTTPTAEFEGRRYALVEALPGASGERDVSPARARAAGRTLARIHDAVAFDTTGWLRVEGTELVAEPCSEPGRVQKRLRDVRGDAVTLRDAGLTAAGDAVSALFAREDVRFPAVDRPVLCHGDYSPDNVLFRGDEVTGVLDFDRAHAGHRQRDLAAAGNAFWMHDPCSDWDPREAVYDGYRAETDPGASFERAEPLYRAETLTRTIAGMVELGELSAYETAFYDDHIQKAVDRAE
jgi:aminoglycoside phosphotransferase (APT) family kinase protein